MRKRSAIRRRFDVLLCVFLVAACGQEAPPRVVSNTPALPTVAPAQAPSPTQPTPASSPTPAVQSLRNPRALGDPNAPIVVIEYGDYQCPYCNTFVRETKPQLEEQYIKTGKVYFVYRDFPLSAIHPAAELAAHAAHCAADQNSFWPMHDRLFGGAEAGLWGSGSQGDFKTFLGYAQELKLDSRAFQRCLETKPHAFQIDTDYRTALQQGVRSTPTFLINGKLLIGAYPYEIWRQVLDDLLPKQ